MSERRFFSPCETSKHWRSEKNTERYWKCRQEQEELDHAGFSSKHSKHIYIDILCSRRRAVQQVNISPGISGFQGLQLKTGATWEQNSTAKQGQLVGLRIPLNFRGLNDHNFRSPLLLHVFQRQTTNYGTRHAGKHIDQFYMLFVCIKQE